MKIAFVYAGGRLQREERLALGVVPSEFFYGCHELESRGCEVKQLQVVDNYKRHRIIRRLGNWFYRLGLLPYRTTGNILASTRELCSELSQYDVVVATTSGIAFALSIWKVLGMMHTPLVAIHCGMLNEKNTWLRRRQTSILLREMYTMLFGRGERDKLIRQFNIPNNKIIVNQFGVDTSFWKPNQRHEGREYILSVGNDGRRDYELLCRVVDGLPIKMIIVTMNKIHENIPDNVKIIRGHWYSEELPDVSLRELYQSASMIVIPLKQTNQPSGQSVCLQAMACAKAVVLTKTDGLWVDNHLHDKENIVFVPPGDEYTLREAIQWLMNNKKERTDIGTKARQYVCAYGDINGFSERLHSTCMMAINEKISN